MWHKETKEESIEKGRISAEINFWNAWG